MYAYNACMYGYDAYMKDIHAHISCTHEMILCMHERVICMRRRPTITLLYVLNIDEQNANIPEMQTLSKMATPDSRNKTNSIQNV